MIQKDVMNNVVIVFTIVLVYDFPWPEHFSEGSIIFRNYVYKVKIT